MPNTSNYTTTKCNDDNDDDNNDNNDNDNSSDHNDNDSNSNHNHNHTASTPGLHNKIPALKIFARGWAAQESICLHYQR